MFGKNKPKIQRVSKGQAIKAAKLNEVIDAINAVNGLRGSGNVKVTQSSSGDWLIHGIGEPKRVDWWYGIITTCGPVDDPTTTDATSSRDCSEDCVNKGDFDNEKYWVRKLYVDNGPTGGGEDLDSDLVFYTPDCSDTRFLHVPAHNIGEIQDGTHQLTAGYVVKVWEVHDDGNQTRYVFNSSPTKVSATGDDWVIVNVTDGNTITARHALACEFVLATTIEKPVTILQNDGNLTITGSTMGFDPAGHHCTFIEDYPITINVPGGPSPYPDDPTLDTTTTSDNCIAFNLSLETTDATPTCMNNPLVVPTGVTWAMSGWVIASLEGDGQSCTWQVDFVVKNESGTATIPYESVVSRTSDLACSFDLVIQNGNELCFEATGVASNNFCWSACVSGTQAGCPLFLIYEDDGGSGGGSGGGGLLPSPIPCENCATDEGPEANCDCLPETITVILEGYDSDPVVDGGTGNCNAAFGEGCYSMSDVTLDGSYVLEHIGAGYYQAIFSSGVSATCTTRSDCESEIALQETCTEFVFEARMYHNDATNTSTIDTVRIIGGTANINFIVQGNFSGLYGGTGNSVSWEGDCSDMPDQIEMLPMNTGGSCFYPTNSRHYTVSATGITKFRFCGG
jgi:hypothetical protein